MLAYYLCHFVFLTNPASLRECTEEITEGLGLRHNKNSFLEGPMQQLLITRVNFSKKKIKNETPIRLVIYDDWDGWKDQHTRRSQGTLGLLFDMNTFASLRYFFNLFFTWTKKVCELRIWISEMTKLWCRAIFVNSK